LSVQDDLAAGGLKLSSQHFEERAFPRSARAHHANEFATTDAEGNSLEADFALAEAMGNFVCLEAANDIALFLDDSLGKIATEKLSDVDPDGVTIREWRRRTHGGIADHDGTVGFDHFQLADAFVVIAENLQ